MISKQDAMCLFRLQPQYLRSHCSNKVKRVFSVDRYYEIMVTMQLVGQFKYWE